ncbi:MAG: ATPase, T2SS/T4P/T4SS family [Planctomycetota bacterium]
MPIKIECPNPKCKKSLQAPDSHAGKKARCPECGTIITIPDVDTVLMAAGADPLIGAKLGLLQIKEKLGQGGMGAVYMAINTSLDRMVAIKVLPEELVKNNPTFLDRFQREAKMAAKLTHPNAVIIYSVGEDKGRHFIEMEFVQGMDLRHVIQNQGQVDLKEASRIIADAARALAAAHKQGIIHRDIKPDNIMLTEEGLVKVADFGLARAATGDSSITMSGQVMGTPLYMSPEQGQGKPTDGRTDIYSLGATYYHALVGLPPFMADTPLQVMMKHATEPLTWSERAEGVPAEIRAIVERMMMKNPAERYTTCDAVIADIENYFKPKAVVARAVQRAAPVAKPLASMTPPKQAYAISADELAAIESAGRSIRRTAPGATPLPARAKGPKWVLPLVVTSVLAIAAALGVIFFISRPRPAGRPAPVAKVPETPEGKDEPAIKEPEGLQPYERYAVEGEKALLPAWMKPDAEGFVPLFNGKDLEGWRDFKGGCVVENGAIVCAGDQPSTVLTDKQYGDGILRFEFRVGPGARGAVLARTVTVSTPCISGIQIPILDESHSAYRDLPPTQRTGSISDLVAAKPAPMKRVGEWNFTEIEMRDRKIAVRINGVTVAETDVGELERLAEKLPMERWPQNLDLERGQIGFATYKSESRLEFRNIRIKELGAAAAPQPRQKIDLLALADPIKDRIACPKGQSVTKANQWERKGRALVYVSDGKAGKIAPPVAIRSDSYEIEIEYERQSGSGRLHVDMPLRGEHIVPVYVDAPGFKIINMREGPVWPKDKAPRGRAVIRLDRGANGAEDHLTLRLDGESLLDWRGNITNVDHVGEPHPEFPGNPITSLYSYNSGYEIRSWQLRVFDGEATILRGAPGAPAGSAGGKSYDGAYVTEAATGEKIPHPLSRKTYTVEHEGKTIQVPEGMIYIPAGPFVMGDDADPMANPAHQADAPAFFMDKHEVTNAQYMEFVKATGHATPKHIADNGEKIPDGRDNYPATYLSWEDAAAYARWCGKRLPTESEWEKAAGWSPSAKRMLKYPWGDGAEESAQPMANDAARRGYTGGGWLPWWKAYEQSNEGARQIALGGGTTPVGTFPNGRSPCGCYDMAGNASEWVEDWFDKYLGNQGMPPDYETRCGNKNRVYRGGNWGDSGAHLRCADRGCNWPGYQAHFTGFRCALSAADFEKWKAGERKSEVRDQKSEAEEASRKGAKGAKGAEQIQNQQSKIQNDQDAFVKEVAALPPEEQVQRVVAKLEELNPGFDPATTEIKHKIEDGQVTELVFRSTEVADISPIRALAHLRGLTCGGVPLPGGRCIQSRLADLTPLSGLPLVRLDCAFSHVNDLSPLSGMRLERLYIQGTRITDLSPLRGMPLSRLRCEGVGSRISDFSPIRDCPLTDLGWSPNSEDTALRTIKTLKMINGMPAADFWKQMDAGKTPGAEDKSKSSVGDALPPSAVEAVVPTLSKPLVKAVESAGGIVILAGPTGSGKSTTGMALVEHLNQTRDCRICTMGEFIIRLTPKRATIQQRLVGKDVPDVLTGITDASRQGVDVLYVEELNRMEEAAAALAAAESGRMVILTRGAKSPGDAVRGIVDLFPPGEQPAVRRRLADVLRAVSVQVLLRKAKGSGRVGACGVVVPDEEMRRAMAEGKDIAASCIRCARPTLAANIQRLRDEGVVTADEAEKALTSVR